MGLIQNETTATKPPKPPSPLRGMAGDRLGTGRTGRGSEQNLD